MKNKTSQNFKVIIMYDGSNFFGWAKQKSQQHQTIQATLEELLTTRLSEKISIIGCSRTDRYVHSSEYVFNFHTQRAIDANQLVELLNNGLPLAIQLIDVISVDQAFHARFSAKSKTYLYKLAQNKPSVFENRYLGYVGDQLLDLDSINQAAKILIGQYDFTTFSAYNKSITNMICNVISFQVSLSNEIYYFEIRGHRFLKQMVRIIVANLILVGQHKISIAQFEIIFKARDRNLSSAIITGKGLHLINVLY